MPLPKVHPRNKYSALLLTFGPYQPDNPTQARTNIKDMVQRMAAHVNSDQITIAFEVGEGGYRHCHIAMGYRKESKPPMKLLAKLKLLATEDSQGRKPNGSIHYVPIDSAHQRLASKRGRYGVLRKYLLDPHKTKMTDQDCIEFVETPTDCIKNKRLELDSCPYPIGSKEYRKIEMELVLMDLHFKNREYILQHGPVPGLEK